LWEFWTLDITHYSILVQACSQLKIWGVPFGKDVNRGHGCLEALPLVESRGRARSWSHRASSLKLATF